MRLWWFFAEEHRGSLRNPYTGEPLEKDWREQLEVGDVQELADFVLTRYYDPNVDCGLGAEWIPIESRLPVAARNALLGKPFGSPKTYFDPGRMGSYFQDEAMARESLRILTAMVDERAALTEFVDLLERAVADT